MEKNIRLIYCILGSVILALINSPMLQFARIGLFPGGYGGHLLGILVVRLSDIVSFVGYVLMAVFSIMLIINNIHR